MKTLRMLSLCAMILASAALLLGSAAPVALDLNQQATTPSRTGPSPTEAVMQLRLHGGLHSPRVDHGPWHPTNGFHLCLGRPPSSVYLGAIRGRPTAAQNAGVAGEVCAPGGHGKQPLPRQGSL